MNPNPVPRKINQGTWVGTAEPITSETLTIDQNEDREMIQNLSTVKRIGDSQREDKHDINTEKGSTAENEDIDFITQIPEHLIKNCISQLPMVEVLHRKS